MDQSNVPGFQKESGGDNRLVDFQPLFASDKSSPSQDSEGPEVKIGRTIAAFDFGSKTSTVEVFTMTLGEETIELLPQKNWAQLDRYKWTPQGKLPGQPLDWKLDWTTSTSPEKRSRHETPKRARN